MGNGGPKDSLVASIAALGHEVRLGIVRQLLDAYPGGLVAGQLQQASALPPSTLSHHLDVLERAGLIERRREGRFLRYRASRAQLHTLLTFLERECAVPRPAADESAAPLCD